MSNHNLSQLAQTAQELSLKLKILNDLMSKAWCEHELAREMLRELTLSYAQWRNSLNKH